MSCPENEEVLGTVPCEVQTMRHHMAVTMMGGDFTNGKEGEEEIQGTFSTSLGGVSLMITFGDFGPFAGVPFAERHVALRVATAIGDVGELLLAKLGKVK